jgi:hypothetical protein
VEFVPLMTVNMCLLGFLGANFSSIALQPFAKAAGSAASAQALSAWCSPRAGRVDRPGV